MSIFTHLLFNGGAGGGWRTSSSAVLSMQSENMWSVLPALKSNKITSKIESIHILGERNSGTTWMYEHLGLCFNYSIPVRRRLKRYKHWFQDETLPTESFQGALVLAMFRNPYDWVEAMRKKPHHAPNHLNLTWHEFVTRPWTMDRVFLDLNVTMGQKQSKHFCQEHFLYDDVVSCHPRPYPTGFFSKTRFSQHQPLYEMKNDASGQPFASILELRTAKINNFLSTQQYDIVTDLWILPYEEVLKEGTTSLIQQIEQVTGIQAQCKASPPQNRRKRILDPDMIQYLTSHIDWKAEQLIGYYPEVQP